MLKSLTAMLACFLSNLGPPCLPAPGSIAVIPNPQATASGLALEALQESTALPQVYHTYLPQAARFNPKLKASIERLINKYAKRHRVDETLVRAVIRQESGGNPQAVSPKGAMGLMQLMPDTAVLMGVDDPFDPEDNLAGGVKYLKFCLDRFQQDPALALAAYNAGPGAVKQHGGVPPYQETQQFVAIILGYETGPQSTKRATKEVKKTSPKELKTETPQEAGLDWQLPRPTLKVPETVVKVPGPKWKVCRATAKFTSLRPMKDTESDGIASHIDSASK